MNGTPDEHGSPTWGVQRDQPETVVQLAVIAHADITPYADRPIRLTLLAPEIGELDDTESAHVQMSKSELLRLVQAGLAVLDSFKEGES